jgi:hypothetical protein
VERFSFGPEAAFVPRGDLLDNVSLAPLAPSSAEGALVQAVILRLSQAVGSGGTPQAPRRSSPYSRDQAK